MIEHDPRAQKSRPARGAMRHASGLLGKSIFKDPILCFYILQLYLGVVYCLAPEQQQHRVHSIAKIKLSLLNVVVYGVTKWSCETFA